MPCLDILSDFYRNEFYTFGFTTPILRALRLLGSSVLDEKKHMEPQKIRTLTTRNPRSQRQNLHPVKVRAVKLFSKATVLVICPRKHGHSPEKNNGQHGYTLRSSNGGVTRTLPGEVFQCLYTQNIPKRYITSVASQP